MASWHGANASQPDSHNISIERGAVQRPFSIGVRLKVSCLSCGFSSASIGHIIAITVVGADILALFLSA